MTTENNKTGQGWSRPMQVPIMESLKGQFGCDGIHRNSINFKELFKSISTPPTEDEVNPITIEQVLEACRLTIIERLIAKGYTFIAAYNLIDAADAIALAELKDIVDEGLELACVKGTRTLFKGTAQIIEGPDNSFSIWLTRIVNPDS